MSLKQHLITSSILQYPKFDQPFYMHTDASGLGAVLSQLAKNKKLLHMPVEV